jgi:hypothetical protein
MSSGSIDGRATLPGRGRAAGGRKRSYLASQGGVVGLQNGDLGDVTTPHLLPKILRDHAHSQPRRSKSRVSASAMTNLKTNFCYPFQYIRRITKTAYSELAVSLEECQKQTN